MNDATLIRRVHEALRASPSCMFTGQIGRVVAEGTREDPYRLEGRLWSLLERPGPEVLGLVVHEDGDPYRPHRVVGLPGQPAVFPSRLPRWCRRQRNSNRQRASCLRAEAP